MTYVQATDADPGLFIMSNVQRVPAEVTSVKSVTLLAWGKYST